MKKEKLYQAPAAQEFDIRSEGILCSSPADAGSLNDNSWDLTFGENN